MCSFPGSFGKNCSPFHPQLLEIVHIPWLMAPFLHLQSQQIGLSLPYTSISLTVPLPPFSSTFKDSCSFSVLTQVIQNSLPISLPTILIPSARLILPCHVTRHIYRFQGVRYGHHWRTINLPITPPTGSVIGPITFLVIQLKGFQSSF